MAAGALSSAGGLRARAPGHGPALRIRAYFASDSRRAIQVALGALWLLDGALQLQPYMYSSAFPAALAGSASGQPGWVAAPITWSTGVLGRHLVVLNTLFALVQVAIGLGLLWRRSVKPALALSVAWSVVVWWSGEGLGLLLTGSANMLTGAPGAVILYAVIGLAVWPTPRPGGLLGVTGTRLSWAAIWLLGAALWMLPANRATDATHETLMMTPAGMTAPAGMRWLSRLEGSASMGAQGHGLAIAIAAAAVSAVVALAVAVNRRPGPFIALAIALSLLYWVIGQGFGGIFYTGSATDPNTGPVLVLLALVVYTLTPYPGRMLGWVPRGRPRPVALFGGLATAAAIALVVAALLDGPTSPPVQPVAAVSPFDGQTFNPPTVAAPIALHDDRGRPVSLSQFAEQGKAVLLTFLATHCPGGCPLAVQLRHALKAMPRGERARVALVAVSLDPRGDSPARVAAFLRRYGLTGQMRYLIGSATQLAPVWSEWNLSAVRSGMALIYGISATGEAVTSYSALFSARELVHDVNRLETL